MRRHQVGAIAMLLSIASAQPAFAADTQVKTLYKAASAVTGCGERWATLNAPDQCRQRIAALRAAEAAPDATAGDKDFLQVERMRDQAALAGVLRQRGDLAGAQRVLDEARRELDRIAPGEENPYFRIRVLDLDRQTALLALANANDAGADTAIQRYRHFSNNFAAVVDSMRDQAKPMNQQRLNAIATGNFEYELGELYATRLEDATRDTRLRDKAREAFQMAREWAVLRASNDWQGFAEKTPQVLYADATLALAQLAKDADDMKALATHLGEARAVACDPPAGINGYDGSVLEEQCLQAGLMARWVTGENQALLRKIAEQQDAESRAIMDALRKKK